MMKKGNSTNRIKCYSSFLNKLKTISAFNDRCVALRVWEHPFQLLHNCYVCSTTSTVCKNVVLRKCNKKICKQSKSLWEIFLSQKLNQLPRYETFSNAKRRIVLFHVFDQSECQFVLHSPLSSGNWWSSVYGAHPRRLDDSRSVPWEKCAEKNFNVAMDMLW